MTSPATFVGRIGSLTSLASQAYYPYRFQIVGLGLLSFAAGIFESIGINAVIPLLSYLVEESPTTDTLTQVMRGLFSFLHLDFSPKYLLSFIVVMFVARGVMMFCIAYVQARISSSYARETRATIFRSMLASSWPSLLGHRLGRLETLQMTDIPSSESLLRHLANSITLMTGLLVYLAAAFTISPHIMVVTLILGLIVIVSSKSILFRIRRLAGERVRLNEEMAHLMSESILGMKTVKAAGVETALREKGNALFARLRDIFVRVTLLQQLTYFLIPPLGVLYIALIFGVAYRTSFISVAALPAIFYLIYRIFLYIQQAQDSLQRVNDLSPHLRNIVSYIEDTRNSVEETDKGGVPFAFNTELRFESVSFAYGSGEDVLHDVSFSVAKGSFVGIIGPSGAGKTTCVDLILRLLTPTKGGITVDSVRAEDIALSDWRSRIAYVSQDIFLIDDTIANNVRFFDEKISDADVKEALSRAHLDDVIEKSEQGIHTHVGERGIKFSAGQRQRIAIARALARKPDILILDEATSALDTESEAKIKELLEELKGSLTVITIAHRLSTIREADVLIALDNGKVVEAGPPEQLLKDKDSYFFKVNAIV